MTISVADAVRPLEARGLVKRRRKDHSDKVIAYVSGLWGQELPADLVDFYRQNIDQLGEFITETPVWNDHVGWRTDEEWVTRLFPAKAVSLFSDGCGNLWGLDLTPGVATPAVYFFEHETLWETPGFAAGSSLGAFLLLLADHDRALDEGWPDKWELKVDPDLEKCPRAPAIWAAG